MRAQWYLMNAKTLTGKQKVPITEVNKHWTICTVYVVRTRGGRPMFASSSGPMAYKVGDSVSWINDTGMGHRSPGYAHDTVTIENVVSYRGGDITLQENNIGMDEKRPLWVFK